MDRFSIFDVIKLAQRRILCGDLLKFWSHNNGDLFLVVECLSFFEDYYSHGVSHFARVC